MNIDYVLGTQSPTKSITITKDKVLQSIQIFYVWGLEAFLLCQTSQELCMNPYALGQDSPATDFGSLPSSSLEVGIGWFVCINATEAASPAVWGYS